MNKICYIVERSILGDFEQKKEEEYGSVDTVNLNETNT